MIIVLISITHILLPLSLCYSNKINYLYKTIFVKEKRNQEEWKIEIPKIQLIANILDGTDEETLNKAVAHFTQSQYILGNVCLAAHNRGYKVNYFSNIKELKKGDEIIYQYKDVKLHYIIYKSTIIKDTDIAVIDNTKENIITLITCVENEPENRRCIQGKLKI